MEFDMIRGTAGEIPRMGKSAPREASARRGSYLRHDPTHHTLVYRVEDGTGQRREQAVQVAKAVRVSRGLYDVTGHDGVRHQVNAPKAVMTKSFGVCSEATSRGDRMAKSLLTALGEAILKSRIRPVETRVSRNRKAK